MKSINTIITSKEKHKYDRPKNLFEKGIFKPTHYSANRQQSEEKRKDMYEKVSYNNKKRIEVLMLNFNNEIIKERINEESGF